MKTFEIVTERKQTFCEGWGVAVIPVFAGDEEPFPESVVEIEVEVVRITKSDVSIIGEIPCVANPLGSGTWIPVENFQQLEDLTEGDTHDLRDRWFATYEEAQAHAHFTKERFDHPAVWESFVCLS